jgi:Uma2 family endonuclease
MDEAPKKRRATYQDVLDAPEHMIAEIINGELRLTPRPGAPATSVASTLHTEINMQFGSGRGGPGGWILLFEPELHFGDEVLVPDLAGWRRERLPFVPDEPFITVPPDWVCEVLSKSTERTDRIEKMPLYASVGVGYAWLVHPRSRTVEAFCLHDGKWLMTGAYKDGDRARIEPFAAVELDLAQLWSDLPYPTKASEPTTEWEYERSLPDF